MIGQQRLGRNAAITPDDHIPSGNEANRLIMQSTWEAEHLCTCWILGVQIDNTASPPVAFSVDVYLWARDFEWNVWGRLGENEGQLNGGNSLTGTSIDGWWFVYQNLEVWKDLYIQHANATGDPVITCELYPMYEQAVELRNL